MSNDKKFSIKSNKCIKCNMCVNVCPANIFVEKNNKIEVDNNNIKYCINCGDCLSVCPRDAVISEGINVGTDISKGYKLESSQFIDFLNSRRTVRTYKDSALSGEEKEYLIEVASLSPRGGHTEDIRNTGVIIVEDKELINEIINYSYRYMDSLRQKLSSIWLTIPKALNSSLKENIDSTIERINYIIQAKNDKINILTYNAPNLVILHSEKGSPISRENLTILEYQMMLGAEVLDLGTCFLGWVSFALKSFKVKKSDELNNILKKLNIQPNREILSLFSIGKKKIKYRKVKSRKINEITII